MKYSNKVLICLILSLILPILIYVSPARSFSHEEILKWVANELKVKKDYPMPEIRIVPREELQRVFRKSTEKSLKRLAATYGKENANKMMDQCIKQLIGLFIPKTNVVYVGRFLEPCKQESIIAHELTHYFQVVENGKVGPSIHNGDDIRFLRELQASAIEEKFMETFCTSPDSK